MSWLSCRICSAARGEPAPTGRAPAATATASTQHREFLRHRLAHRRGKRGAAQPADRHRPQDRRTRRTQGSLRQDRRAVQQRRCARSSRKSRRRSASPACWTKSRAAYETLRTEFYQIEKQGDRARSRSREAARRPRTGARVEPRAGKHAASNSPTKSPRAARRSPSSSASWRRKARSAARSSENRRALQDQFDIAEKRIIELEGELAAAREKLALLEDEKRSLQIAVDQALNETARLTRRLTESENTLTATRAQLGKVETSFAEAYAERGRLAAALDEIRGAASGRAQQPEHAARRLAVARRHRRAAAGRGAAEPDRPHRGSARLRPQVGRSDHRPQQRRKAARRRSKPRTRRASARSRISSRRARRSPSATTP